MFGRIAARVSGRARARSWAAQMRLSDRELEWRAMQELHQGLWDFQTLDSYVQERVIPYVLVDLETVFTGAMEYWAQHRDGRIAGRGDFLLATILFSLMDHFGSFLTGNRRKTSKNIAACAARLRGFSGIEPLLSRAGRNALVHNAFPQTIIAPDEGPAFGLSVSARADATALYIVRNESFELHGEDGEVRRVPVTQVLLYLHPWRRELHEAIKSGRMFQSSNPTHYTRLRAEAIKSCHLRNLRAADRRELLSAMEAIRRKAATPQA
jgi:hypothetical protein